MALQNVYCCTIFPQHLMSYLSVGGGFNIRVALFTNDVIDVAQRICRDARKSSGAVWGKIAVGTPCVTKISRALDDHCCRPESLKKKGLKTWLGPLQLSVMFGHINIMLHVPRIFYSTPATPASQPVTPLREDPTCKNAALIHSFFARLSCWHAFVVWSQH